MKLDFLTRATGSASICLGLVWAFLSSGSGLALVAILPGVFFYLIGAIGLSARIRETRGYAILLVAFSAITVITGLVGLFQIGFSPINFLGQALLMALLWWFCRAPLSVLRSSGS